MWTTTIREALARVTKPTRPVTPPRLRVSDRYPNVKLTTHLGETLRFRDAYLDGRALVLNTMFTTCRGSCPQTSAAIKKLRVALWPVFGPKLTFVSITLEPTVDTPSKLKDYASLHDADTPKAGLCDWQFVTGAEKDIDGLRRSLGFYDLDPKVDADITRHAALLFFGNPAVDRWAALPAALPHAELVRTIRRVAGFTFEHRYGIPS